MRSSLVGVLEAPEKSMEAILWTGFLFLKASQPCPLFFKYLF